MKSKFLSGMWIIGLVLAIPAIGQEFTLEECQQKAQEVSPLQQQKLYNQSIRELRQANVNSTNLPQLQLSAQATYQSDVFALPFSIPGSEVPEIPKGQYRASLTIQQKLFDGGTARRNKELVNAESQARTQEVEVGLYQIVEHINQLYFGLLLQQEREKILLTHQETLNARLKEVESLVKHGVVLRSNLLALQKQLLTLDQQMIEIQSSKDVLRAMLSKWIDQEIGDEATYKIPDADEILADKELNTPQLSAFNSQIGKIEAAKSIQSVRNAPKLFAFATGGVGSPNPYNFFETDFSNYYMLGVKLEWNIYDYGRKKNDIKVLGHQAQMVNVQKENYIRTMEIGLMKQLEDTNMYEQLLDRDAEILMLQEQVVKEANAQLKNGVITSTQYLTEVNNQIEAQLNAKVHELKLIETKIQYLTKSGNL